MTRWYLPVDFLLNENISGKKNQRTPRNALLDCRGLFIKQSKTAIVYFDRYKWIEPVVQSMLYYKT